MCAACPARPVRDGGDWVVNGTKHFISGADHADFFIVFIATGVDDTPKGPKKRITCFLVDRGTPGFTMRDGYQSVSHRGYKNCILEFDDCRLPDAQVLGEVDGGFEVMNTWLYATRLTVAAFSVGRARRCFDHAVAYAAERKQFGQQIAKFQGVSFQVADMITEIDAADWLTLAAPGGWTRACRRTARSPRQALCLRDAGAGDRHDLADLRRHGADVRLPDRTVLARCAGGTDLGRHVGNPAPHHQPRPVSAAGGLTRRAAAVAPSAPRSIAVIGGGTWCANVIEGPVARSGFPGPVWPVHPTKGRWRACLRSRGRGLPEHPRRGLHRGEPQGHVETVRVLSECGAGGAVCFASGFRESVAETGDGDGAGGRLVEAAGDAHPRAELLRVLNFLDGAALWPDVHGAVRVERGVA
jgi:hypothetical protein